MFTKLTYQDVCCLIDFLSPWDSSGESAIDPDDYLSEGEIKALDKLKAIKSLQELKYNRINKI